MIDFGVELAGIFVGICPNVQSASFGLHNRKTELRGDVRFDNGDSRNFFARGKMEPDDARRMVAKWAEEAKAKQLN